MKILINLLLYGMIFLLSFLVAFLTSLFFPFHNVKVIRFLALSYTISVLFYYLKTVNKKLKPATVLHFTQNNP